MKLKKQASKKLSINKQTVAHLGNIDMDKARGGTIWTDSKTGITCVVCNSRESCIAEPAFYCMVCCPTHEYICG